MVPFFAYIISIMEEQLKIVHLYNQHVMEQNARIVAENAEMRRDLARMQKLKLCECECCNAMDTS